MKLSKSMLAAGVVTTIAAASIVGIGAASAQSNTGDSIVDRIATKFNLNRDDVQTVFDAQHDEMEAKRDEKRSTKLQALVDNGKLTAKQKSALEAKETEMEAKRNALKSQNLTREEMHNQMKTARTEFESWAKQQGINLSIIRPGGGMMKGHNGGPRGGMHGTDRQ